VRRLIFVFLILIVAISALWIFAGRQISSFVDRFKMAKVKSIAIHSIAYEGTGDGGTLLIEDHRLALNPTNAHVGSTKDNQLALAYAGKVFAFGLLRSSEPLAADAESGDTALLALQRTYLRWPSFDGSQLNWNGPNYYRLAWTKRTGARLEMIWSIDDQKNATSLIRIEISDAAR
jgi:hypothetical protein